MKSNPQVSFFNINSIEIVHADTATGSSLHQFVHIVKVKFVFTLFSPTY